MKRKIKKADMVLIFIYLLMIILNAASWLSTAFSDWYAGNILPVWVNIFSRASSVIPFSLGEIMIIAAVLIIVAGTIAYILLMIFGKGKRNKISFTALRIFLWIMAFIVTTETMNCFIMYHCTPFSDEYFSEAPEEYPTESLVKLYEIVVNNLNELSDEVERDENGNFILTDDLYKTASDSMRKLSAVYPQLSGYYPEPKKIMFSGFVSQQYLMGVFFPFSLEVNYNKLMSPINYPDTICHEYAHLKGIMPEDEAGFVSFLACTGSDSAQFRYSGYLSVINYIENDVYECITERSELERVDAIHNSMDISVVNDNVFLTYDAWEEVEEKAVVSTDVINDVSDVFTDTSLKLNGVSDGKASYGRKVKLLLDYYETEGSLK